MSAPAFAFEAVRVPAAPVVAKGDLCRITWSSVTVRAQSRTSSKALGTAYEGDTYTAHGWAECEVSP